MTPLSTSMTSTPSCLPPARTRLRTPHLSPAETIPESLDVIFQSFTETLPVESVSKIESSIASCAITLPPVSLLTNNSRSPPFWKALTAPAHEPSEYRPEGGNKVVPQLPKDRPFCHGLFSNLMRVRDVFLLALKHGAGEYRIVEQDVILVVQLETAAVHVC